MNKSWSVVIVAILKYVVGPILAVVLGIGYSNCQHERSAKGYGVLAKNFNEQILAKLIELDSRIDALEKHAVAPAPVTTPFAPLIDLKKIPVESKAAPTALRPLPPRAKFISLQRLPEQLEAVK